MHKQARALAIAVIVALFTLCGAGRSQEPVAPAACSSNAVAPGNPDNPVGCNTAIHSSQPEIALGPLIMPDCDIFRRTPLIDGTLEDGEWDKFYSYTSGDWEVTTYADWDARFLYVAARSNKPFELMFVLDANNDGWFHGDENYEVKVAGGVDDNITLSVRRYESRNVKTPTAAPATEAEIAMVDVKSVKSANDYMIEMKVPSALIRGFKLDPGKKVGMQINIKPSVEGAIWVPTDQVGDVRECTLATKKVAALKPLVLGFDLKDSVVARGEELVGRFHITNGGTETLDAREYIIAGEGKTGSYLSSQRIRIEGLPPRKHISREVRTVVPSDMPVGSWAIGAEVRSADARLGGVLVSFDVVDPFEADIKLPAAEVRADVKDVTFQVLVKNNTRKAIRGKVKVTLPTGWELWKNADTREFVAGPRGAVAFAKFKAKPPLGEMGPVPVKAEVTVGRETKTVEGKFHVVSP
ncbi:MAG: hypothetical protein N3B12_07310 [Armatimonadetes bacterium]|nr:hypothetical protein [Armatimonadota bacterium]